ncbi:MAG TPA: peptidyl-prolyl cis-trans isomerase [Rectinemataceae bacterium]|nr:peptidyl-prolyl cis-trans isomerase [Rectinemataceae bacterium]
MKRNKSLVSIAATIALLLPLSAAGAQTIDKPAATVKLIKLEVYSVRQFKADVDKVEAAIGRKLDPATRRQMLDSQLNALLFKQYCDREKILVTDADVNSGIAEMKQQVGPNADDAQLEAAMRSQGIFNDPKTYVRQQLLLSRFLQAKKADELKALKSPTPDEILKAYDLQKSALVRPDTDRVSILYIDLRGKSDAEKKKSSDTFRAVVAQLKSNSAKFDELMLKAADPQAGYKATVSLMVEKTPQAQNLYGNEFFDAVFKLKVGEISPLIENAAGLQVVRLNEALPQKQLTLSDPVPGQANATVQDYIAYNLTMKTRTEFLQKVQDDLLAQLRKEATIKIFDENLNF